MAKKKGKKATKAPKVAPVDKTPEGKKKDVVSQPMPTEYFPSYVEAAWYQWWEKCGFFKPDFKDKKEEKDFESKFVMVIPPPNVTGTLHLGHTLMCAIEDTITRWQRMCGKKTLWLPGTDHAGIATQSVVEKKLMRERKQSRRDLGREKFLEEVWKWKEESGSHICRQLRRLGSSCDWTREAFTMDKQLNKAVKEAFCRMYEKKLIYRKARLVNWSCQLQTAISDVEVDKEDIDNPKFFKVPGHEKKVEFGVIHKFKYPMKEDPSRTITVATTRIETMLGDVAVAVHPTDARYKDLIGKELQHPLIPERKMKVIADDILVDPKFGTGAVKITPAHDHNDFECGMRHKLPFINLLNDDGTMNSNAGKYKGMKRFVVREKIIEDLKELGLYVGKDKNKMVLGFCSRSGDVIEPVIRPQWWVDCKDMARRSVEAVETGELEVLPEIHKKTWYHFLKNIQPWCISRQLWWGHRIPAYFIKIKGYNPSAEELKKGEAEGYIVGSDADANFWVAARDEAEATKKATERFSKCDAKDISVHQDEDVLDTWFSSGLFPFSTMGWPDNTQDVKEFFPGHLLETGHDIIFFWVARMVMMSLELMDVLPFKTVYLHPMVRDKLGRKMSKSRGNVVDPIHVMEGVSLQKLLDKIQKGNLPKSEHKSAMIAQRKDFPKGIPECGADALRYGLMTYMKQGGSINLDINVVVSCRHFCNKLWNATKFALSMFDKDFKVPKTSASELSEDAKRESISLINFVSCCRPTRSKFPKNDELKSASIADMWILNKLHKCIVDCGEGFTSYEFAKVTTATMQFWLYEFCDFYLEMIKPTFYGKDSTPEQKLCAQRTLYICIDAGLRLLHPLMPFVTEELWQRLPGRDHSESSQDSIMLSRYPMSSASKRWESSQTDALVKLAINVVKETRSLRERVKMLKSNKPVLYVKQAESAKDLSSVSSIIATMALASDVKLISDAKSITEASIRGITGEYEIFLPLKGVKLDELCLSYEKKLENIQALANEIVTKQNEAKYAKTPEHIKVRDKEKVAQYGKEAKTYEDNLRMFLSKMSAEERKVMHEGKIKTTTANIAKYKNALEALEKKLPDKSDKSYKKVYSKLTPKIKKAKNNLNLTTARLERLKTTDLK
mmetsp:Transcript_5382/g.7932  ORF Transcript_5382/g.7932 Transcript_5382/m.7932 type:complete len:1126 (+) Transcript_5382:65-3442(+)